jgi:hypothetical protein
MALSRKALRSLSGGLPWPDANLVVCNDRRAVALERTPTNPPGRPASSRRAFDPGWQFIKRFV